MSVRQQAQQKVGEEKLIESIWANPDIRFDPYNFTMFAWPWGQSGTPLARHKGPKQWQADVLKRVGEAIKDNHETMNVGLVPKIVQEAICSGRGIGKTALFGMLTHWFRSCFPGGTCIVSANTEPQLRTRTFPEIAKWMTMAINAHWFHFEGISITPTEWFSALIRRPAAEGGLALDTAYYYTKGQLWAEENPDAFAGAHSQVAMMVIFDEASGIPRVIYPVAAGYFTDPTPYRFWFQFSNGRRNVGGFYDAFHPEPGKPNPWRTQHIDARTIEGVDIKVLQQIVDQYGEDSDQARVEVRGLFPRRGDDQLISTDAINNARYRPLRQDPGAPLIMGVDVARYGRDSTKVHFRQGTDARSIVKEQFSGLDFVAQADRIEALIHKYGPDAICIDTALGAAVVDILKRRGHRRIHEINFGQTPTDPQYASKRVELYCRARDWLNTGCLPPDDHLLASDLAAPVYWIDEKSQRIKIQDKDDLRAELGRSPDDGDAFVLTFAVNPPRRDFDGLRRRAGYDGRCKGVDYPLFRR